MVNSDQEWSMVVKLARNLLILPERYGGNKESKKVQRTLLKQQYENFAGLSSETMDQTFDRLQKLITQLEIQGEVITQEDMNLKLLRSLPSEWKTHALIWRNKQEIETISLDDLYNNLKIYEPEISGSSSTSQNPQNVAFVSSNSTNSNSSTNEADNTAYGVSTAHTQSNPTSGDNLSDAVICAFLASQPNSPQISQEDLEQIDPDDLEEMDLQWEMAMLTIRARRFIKRARRKLDVNSQRVRFDRRREINRRTVIVETPTKNALVAQDGIRGYDWSYQAEEEHLTNFALMALTSLGSSSSSDSEVDSCSKSCVKAYATLKEKYDNLLAHYKKNEAVYEESINVLNLEVKLRDNALIENKMKLEKAEKERDELKLTLEKFQNSSKSLNNLLESQVSVKFKTRLGFNADSSTAASPIVESFVNSSKMLENQENNKSKSDKGYHAVPSPYTGNFMPRKPDLTFMDEIVESENLDVTTVVTPSNVKAVESNHESANVKSNGDALEPKTVRNNSFRPPVIEDWNSNDESEVDIIPKVKTVSFITEKIKLVKLARETVIRPVWNNSSRVNHKNFANKMTHPHPNRIFVPQAVLTKSGKINTAGTSVNTAVRPVNNAGSKPTVNHPRPISNAYKKGYSQVTRPFNKFSQSLMYLTASRPDIMFAVCACARDSPFDLEAFSDSDYAGASHDRKSTTGGCQFLGKRLISWQCKKQTVVSNSTAEAEYVAAANCCGQVLWVQNQMLDYGFNFMNTKIYIDNESTICIVKNPVFHSKTKHIEIRHHFIRDSYEKKLIQVIKIHTDHNVADLLTKAFDVSRFNFLIASIGLLNL
ncbi:hypothetical protein Tco_1218347 [Tanacetum coccineum]